MTKMNESEHLDASPTGKRGPFEEMVLHHYRCLPIIDRLDEYQHFKEQLRTMRALSSEFNAARIAMEMGLFCRLADYEKRIGMPRGLMPQSDGKGGIEPEAVVPEDWLS